MQPLKQTPTRTAFVVRRTAIEKSLVARKELKEKHNKENWKGTAVAATHAKNENTRGLVAEEIKRLNKKQERDLLEHAVPIPADIRPNKPTRLHEKMNRRREQISEVQHLKTNSQLTSKTPKKSNAGIRKRQSSHQKHYPNQVTPRGVLATSAHITAHSCLGEEEQETETPTERQYRRKLEQIRSHLRLMKAETTRRIRAKNLESMYESRRAISPRRPPAFSASPSRSPVKSAISSRQTSPVRKQPRSTSPFRAFTESSKAYKPLMSPVQTEFRRRSRSRSASPRRYPAMSSQMTDHRIQTDSSHAQYQTGQYGSRDLQSSATKPRPSYASESGQKSPSLRKRSPCRKIMPESMLSRSRVPVRLGDFATSKRKEFLKGLEQAYRELLPDDTYGKIG